MVKDRKRGIEGFSPLLEDLQLKIDKYPPHLGLEVEEVIALAQYANRPASFSEAHIANFSDRLQGACMLVDEVYSMLNNPGLTPQEKATAIEIRNSLAKGLVREAEKQQEIHIISSNEELLVKARHDEDFDMTLKYNPASIPSDAEIIHVEYVEMDVNGNYLGNSLRKVILCKEPREPDHLPWNGRELQIVFPCQFW